MNPPLPSPERATDMRRRLLSHYDRTRRDLPWRGESDPYRVLVSEVMLQQTRAETVRRYYGPWLERFPDVESLAAADPDEVLKAWEGLGYYRRARNLHTAAQIVRERFDGSLPDNGEALRGLPGIGDYTAGAVASIAFGEAVPAVDGNVRRVLSRLMDVAEPKPAWLRDVAGSLVDPRRPGDWNQALMDLGATVCRPKGPLCPECPLGELCAARRAGSQEDRPRRRERRAVPDVTFVLGVFAAGRRVLLVRRPSGGLLGDMWAFPEVELTEEGSAEEAVLGIAGALGLSGADEPSRLPAVEHRFTHVAATYLPWRVEVESSIPDREVGPGKRSTIWIDRAGSSELAIPVAQQKVLASVRAHA